MTTQLTPHFTLEELTITQVRGFDNTPPPEIAARLLALAQMLENIRYILGNVPVLVNSGYRSPEVNKAVGGVPNSAHTQGYAADFIAPRFGTPLEICRALSQDHLLKFDQLIEEGTWVHCSIAPTMRGQVLTKAPGGGYGPGLPSD